MHATRTRGMSLVEVVVGIAIMLSVFTALFGLLLTSLKLSSLARAKAAALELASTQLEYLRGLPYASLGTVGGTPSGSIVPIATSTMSGIPYGVRTQIVYYDDPADGSGGADADSNTADYKKAKVTVTYTTSSQTGSVILLSSFAPPGI